MAEFLVMAGMSAATAGSIGTALTAVSTVLGAFGAIRQGQAQSASYKAQAAQLEQNAGQRRAEYQRRAINERRKAKIAQERSVAVSAAGGGALDKTGVDIYAALGDEGTYRADVLMAEGENSAIDLEYQGAMLRSQAKEAKKAGISKAFGTVLGGAGTFFGKFNPEDTTSSYSGQSRPYGGYYQNDFHKPYGSAGRAGYGYGSAGTFR